MTVDPRSLRRSIPWRLAQGFARILAAALFDLRVYGRENVPPRGGALIVSNHQSYLDPVLLPLRLERPLNYIARAELFRGPIRGYILRSIFNAFPVRQGAGDLRAVKETIHRLRDGHLLNLYPEGARTFDGEIGPMRPGVGLIVHRAGVPVIPAVLVGAFEAWPRQRRLLRPGPIRIRYGPALNLSSLAPEEIVAKIDVTLREMFQALRAAR